MTSDIILVSDVQHDDSIFYMFYEMIITRSLVITPHMVTKNCLSYDNFNIYSLRNSWIYYTVLVTIFIMLYITSLAVVQSQSHVWLFATPWNVALQASLFLTIFRNLPKFMSIYSVMLSNHFRPLRLIYFITGNLYLLIPSTHFTQPSPNLPLEKLICYLYYEFFFFFCSICEWKSCKWEHMVFVFLCITYFT